MRKMFKTGALTRPKMAEALAAYDATCLTPLSDAIRARDLAAFTLAHDAAVAEANRVHGELGYGYIEWQVPSEPPRHLTLTPVARQTPDV